MAKKTEEVPAEPVAEKPKAKADRPLDETVPGGRYITSEGRTVNAEGEEIK